MPKPYSFKRITKDRLGELPCPRILDVPGHRRLLRSLKSIRSQQERLAGRWSAQSRMPPFPRPSPPASNEPPPPAPVRSPMGALRHLCFRSTDVSLKQAWDPDTRSGPLRVLKFRPVDLSWVPVVDRLELICGSPLPPVSMKVHSVLGKRQTVTAIVSDRNTHPF